MTSAKRISNKLPSRSNYYTTEHFLKILVAIKMNKIKVKMNKPVYLGLSVLVVSKTDMYKYWYE